MTPQASERSRSASPTRRKRLACQYCFKRKMKCDMLEPKCSNCEEQGKDCIPAERVSRARPTHGRIEQLEREVERLQAHIKQMETLPLVQSMGPSRLTGYESGRSDSAVHPEQDGQDELNGGGRARFMGPAHGPTSYLFDDAGEPDFDDAGQDAIVPEEELKQKATARSAEERHMEVLNLASGRLDFDGVPPDLAMHLLALHWNRQHFAFLISYRPLFMRDMACQGPYFSRLLLNAIFFSVSKFSERPDVYDDPLDQTTAGRRFLRRVKELLGAALDQSTIPTIQAMLLLSSSLGAHGHQSAAWLYSGIAIRMIFDLGLNYDSALSRSSLLPEEIEIRRRVVWASYIMDKIISLYQGRAVSFGQERMHVPHRFLDWYEEQELWTPFAFPGIHRYPGAPARAISTFKSLCSLSVIMDRIVTDVYADKGPMHRPGPQLEHLSRSLQRWKAALPMEIAFDPNSDQPVPPPHVLSLHSVYHTLVILLHRPFVETGLQNLSPSVVQISWQRCEEAAKGSTDILARYMQTFTLARAPYLISYTIYVAATIHVRMVAQQGRQSESARLLEICLEGLRENSATNPGVGRMYRTITRVMERLGVHNNGSEASGSVSAMLSDELDMSAIIRSFGVDPSMMADFTSQAFAETPMDNLYGFLGLQQ